MNVVLMPITFRRDVNMIWLTGSTTREAKMRPRSIKYLLCPNSVNDNTCHILRRNNPDVFIHVIPCS